MTPNDLPMVYFLPSSTFSVGWFYVAQGHAEALAILR